MAGWYKADMANESPVGQPGDTVASVLARHARARGPEPFLVVDDGGSPVVWATYASMADRARTFAALLRASGIGPGDRIHVHLANRPDFYTTWFGAAIARAVMVPTNPGSPPDEIRYAIEFAHARLSVTEPALLGVVRAATGADHEILVTGEDEVDGVRGLGPALAAVDPATAPDAMAARPTDPLAILYTSGTTSRPKGVIVTQAAYVHAGSVVAEHLRLRPDDRHLVVLPLFHGNAQYYSSMSALVTGASIGLVERFSASRWSAQAESLGATVASLFAAPIRMILAQPPSASDRRHRLRAVLFAQNLTPGQLDDFEARFGVPLVQLYGMTETVVPPLMNPLYGERRNMTMGRPVLSARVRIIDEDGRDVPAGEVGELAIAGEPGRTMMAGYLDDPAATDRALRDGWLHTGDSVRADADGYLSFVDRRKDLIKRAGENVSTGEVERVIEGHPAVFEAAVIGVPDPIRDEAVKAFVVLREGTTCTGAEVIEWCAARLSKFKVPSFVVVVDELPRTSVGKIQKHLLERGAQGPDGPAGAPGGR